MSLVFYNEEQNVFGGSEYLRTRHNGSVGSVEEKLIYIRNNDVSKWYTNLLLEVQQLVYGSWDTFTAKGWSVKLLYGERRPTESEWATIDSGDSIQLPDIGAEGDADIDTYHPVWIRVSCPAGESVSIRQNIRLALKFYERVV